MSNNGFHFSGKKIKTAVLAKNFFVRKLAESFFLMLVFRKPYGFYGKKKKKKYLFFYYKNLNIDKF